MDSKTLYESAAKGQDLQDLLNHIAWEEILYPALMKHRKYYADIMVNKVLGATTDIPLSLEQIAGRVAGIDFVVAFIQNTLARGDKALQTLRDHNINLE